MLFLQSNMLVYKVNITTSWLNESWYRGDALSCRDCVHAYSAVLPRLFWSGSLSTVGSPTSELLVLTVTRALVVRRIVQETESPPETRVCGKCAKRFFIRRLHPCWSIRTAAGADSGDDPYNTHAQRPHSYRQPRDRQHCSGLRVVNARDRCLWRHVCRPSSRRETDASSIPRRTLLRKVCRLCYPQCIKCFQNLGTM